MSALTKILLAILLLVSVVFGIEVFLYYQVLNKPNPTSPTSASQATPELMEIKRPVALVGFLNLFDITKAQVGTWAKVFGPVDVPTYSGPIPSPPFGLISATTPSSVKVIAGFFKNNQVSGIVISQGGKDLTLTFSSGARLWIRNRDKLQIVSQKLDSLLASDNLSKFVNVNDLVLVPNINEAKGGVDSPHLVVFK